MAPTSTPCPTCKRPVIWGAGSPHRPFCSERCRLIDLGAWFSGERAIPANEAAPAAPDSEDL